jgi:RimJ/RimL family protein N-acetyltransferase
MTEPTSEAMPSVPAIETERLTLRGHRLDDFGASAALWSDPGVTRHIGGRPLSAEEVWTRLLRYVGHWSALGYGYWVVSEKSTGRFVGECGLADYHRAITPSIHGIPEAGWALTPSAHGRGYATEAMRAVLAWADRQLRSRRTVCLISPGNLASIRVAEKLGFGEHVRTTYHGEATLLFERAAPPDGG